MSLLNRPLIAATLLASTTAALAAGPVCQAESASTLTPVIELYTSEGCSSCPPADRWLSTLKDSAAGGKAVVQAFHVGYWDHIGWVDRFASAAHTARQRQVAAANSLSNIYTPQLVRNGKDWREDGRALASAEPARARIAVQLRENDAFEASVAPLDPAARWSAYWTVTEHGHNSKVKAGENAGEFLKHDFVVRQYTPVGEYKSSNTAQKLAFRSIAPTSDHPRQINLVVFDTQTGATLQALSLQCTG